jgi:hypothetical protein
MSALRRAALAACCLLSTAALAAASGFERTASLEATIRVSGEPAVGWRCVLLDRSSRESKSSRELHRLETGADGACRATRLPEGLFWLRVISPVELGATAEREVQLYRGETSSVAFDLAPIVVEGQVLRGHDPVPGYTVRIFRLGEETVTSLLLDPVAEAVSGVDGGYQITLWDAGRHSFQLADARGWSSAMAHEDVHGPVTRVDFHLTASDLEGVVVDERGDPVADASVVVHEERGLDATTHRLRSGEDGAFRLAFEAEAATLEVSARQPGFRPASVRFTLEDGEAPPAIRLVLRRGGQLRGRVVTAAGQPSVDAMVISFDPGPAGALVQRGLARTDREGRFEVLAAEEPPTRLFVTGHDCPLHAAEVTAEGPEPLVLACPGQSGTLLLRLRDEEGRPVPGELVFLSRGAEVIPALAIAGHLSLHRHSLTSEGSGRLVIPSLAPGRYDVFLVHRASEVSVAQGLTDGHLGSAYVDPGATVELEARVDGL